MEFLVLGPIETRDRGRPLAIGAPRTRTMLALLLTLPNTLVRWALDSDRPLRRWVGMAAARREAQV
jgi:hypothetical protein